MLFQVGDQRRTQKVVLPEREHANLPLRKSNKIKLAEQPECASDVQRLCSKLGGTNNFVVMDCLQSDNLVIIIVYFVINC